MEITGNLLATLLPLLIFVVLGFLLLLVWLFWVSSRRGKNQEARATTEQGPGAADGTPSLLNRVLGTPPAPAGAPDARLAAPSAPPRLPDGDGDTVEVFRVLRDLADGALIGEIEGKRYSRVTEITDGQVGRRFVANARALAHFAMLLKGPPPPAPPPQATTPPPPAPERTVAAAPPAPPQVSRTAIQMAKEAQSDEQPATQINLADQIEELLHYRLTVHPTLALRSIHVRPSFGGGVRIVVDNTSYDSVDEVPEEEIREFIQATIREWNARN
ncbi:MAG: hypothetical protein JSV36_05300 [Anaerolineae bacterium]|nr:MAG: hypothetical protein JSV36_05300 [Anaerolineae bacterium]